MKNKKNNHNYLNRELSWLEFNQRVLDEAKDESNPLLERLKFLAITASNLDEFFMVRVGSLWDQVQANFKEKDPSGLAPIEQLESIGDRAHKMSVEQQECYNDTLLPCLRKEHIYILRLKELRQEDKLYIEKYYNSYVFPVLTPMVVDKSRPFPLILNKSLNIALLLEHSENKEETIFATVQVPSVLKRLVEIPTEGNSKKFVLLEDIIKLNINSIFVGYKVIAMGAYRLTRNADLSIDEEGAEDLLETIEQSIRLRRWGATIKLEYEKELDARILTIIKEEEEIEDKSLYEIKGPLDLTFLFKLYSIEGYAQLKFKAIKPVISRELLQSDDIFQAISNKDIVLHHPYESFDSVVELIKTAAKDPKVLAIKQTLYRVSGKSPIVEALAEAADNGKQVTALLELKARFDEENNINWAKRLEQAGCHVIYGLVGLKTHGKILLIVRREEDGIKRYVHMSTGNYNDVTANIYTDIGFITSNPYFGADASILFNMLSGYSQIRDLNKINIAPTNLRKKFLYLINRETENSRNGKKAKIIAKMNSLVDVEIIDALYKASNAGVTIELIVRGICCLKPGVPGLSENIVVRSIVGRFLEHSRIYYFYNNGDDVIYLSSADWMSRNLDRRVEILFPIEDKKNSKVLKEILSVYLKDNVKARVLNKDGKYIKPEVKDEDYINSQEYFYSKIVEDIKSLKKLKSNMEEFKPITLIN